MKKHNCSYSDEDLIQILKEMNQIARCQQSNTVYNVFAQHPDTLAILMGLLQKDHGI